MSAIYHASIFQAIITFFELLEYILFSLWLFWNQRLPKLRVPLIEIKYFKYITAPKHIGLVASHKNIITWSTNYANKTISYIIVKACYYIMPLNIRLKFESWDSNSLKKCLDEIILYHIVYLFRKKVQFISSWSCKLNFDKYWIIEIEL